MILSWEIPALLLFELSPAHSVCAMPSCIPSVKWKIQCAGDKFQCSLWCVPMSLPQEHPKRDEAFGEATTGFYHYWRTKLRVARNRMWKKEEKKEKEEPSGKNLTYQQNIPSQASSPHHTGLSCESCLSDGQSSALPESHTGMSLSTLLATVRFWVQIFWFEPEMETVEWWNEGLKHIYSLRYLTGCVTERGARFSKKAFTLHLQHLHTCIQRVWCTNNTFWHAKYTRT